MTTDSAVAGAEAVEAIAAVVLASPAVAGLHGGRFTTVASYLPGRRVIGVAVTPSEITVGVVGRYPNTVAQIAAQVRAAVATVVPGVAVTVAIEDIDIEDIDIAPVDPSEGDRQEVVVSRDRIERKA
jgi:voltage-gated potassium channel Kch